MHGVLRETLRKPSFIVLQRYGLVILGGGLIQNKLARKLVSPQLLLDC